MGNVLKDVKLDMCLVTYMSNIKRHVWRLLGLLVFQYHTTIQ